MFTKHSFIEETVERDLLAIALELANELTIMNDRILSINEEIEVFRLDPSSEKEEALREKIAALQADQEAIYAKTQWLDEQTRFLESTQKLLKEKSTSVLH